MTSATERGAPATQDLGLWSAGVERWAHRIFTVWTVVALASGPSIEILSSFRDAPRPATWLLGAFLCVAVVLSRLLAGRMSPIDVVIANVALLLALWTNQLVDAAGSGADSGPALPFALAILIGYATFAPTRVAMAIAPCTAALYVALRELWTGPGLVLSGIDEMIVLGGTGVSIHVLMRVLRSAAAQADRLHALDLESERSRAREEARRHSIDEVRHVLHDDVVAALVLIDLSSSSSDDAARHAARAAVEELEQFRSFAGPRPRTSPLAYAPVDVTFEIDETFRFDDYPTAVQSAVAGAAMEALRNVRRHAGVDRARMRATSASGGGLVFEIIDEGRGIGAGHGAGFGITVSIVSRMRDVGGAAEVSPRPGGGTIVRLTWTPPSRDAEVAVDPWSAAWSSIMTSVPRMRTDLALIVYTYAASQAWAALRHADAGRSVVGGACTAAGLLVLTWVTTRRASRAPLTARWVLALVSVLVAFLAAGLWNAGAGALLSFDSWVEGMTVAPLIVVALLTPSRWTILAAIVNCVTVLVAAVVDPTIAPADALSPITGTVVATGAFLAAAVALRRISAQVSVVERVISSTAVAEVRSTARAELLSQDLAHLGETVLPFLTQVADGVVTPGEAAVRERARTLAAQVRDDLLVPTVLDAELRGVLAQIRAAGGTVTFRVDDLPPDDPALIRHVLATILDPLDRMVVIRISGSGARVAVTIGPALTEDRARRLRSVLGGVDLGVGSGDRTRITVDCSDRQAPSPAPDPWVTAHDS